MPLARLHAPFEHPDWIFEPKLDGFRALAYIEDGACRLVSRKVNVFKTFGPLAAAIGEDLAGQTAILDGEIVRPGADGRPLFYELMRRHGPFCFYAFDLVWLGQKDLRPWPLVEMKSLLEKLVPRRMRAGRYVEHVWKWTNLFRVICERDMEGIVAKQANGAHTPEATTWVRIKNRRYSQAVGRHDFFGRRRENATWLRCRSGEPGQRLKHAKVELQIPDPLTQLRNWREYSSEDKP
jgi:bifunctional non-homologous end joining protein LigD